ncbi:hypothetical protein EV126DRAFT_422628 [Verticillium dahliae]|nr:hypothetical protein EV126DRAFT_422628 [Verticillium dahliae]
MCQVLLFWALSGRSHSAGAPQGYLRPGSGGSYDLHNLDVVSQCPVQRWATARGFKQRSRPKRQPLTLTMKRLVASRARIVESTTWWSIN